MISNRWAVRIPTTEAASVICLRNEPEIEVLVGRSELWLQGKFDPDPESESNDRVQRRLRKILGAVRFHVMEDQQLVPFGHRVPMGQLPTGDWHPLASRIDLRLPIAGLPGLNDRRLTLRLVRGTSRWVGPSCEPELLLVALKDWLDYASSAPKIRLQPLAFACDNQGRVLIRGKPLPPIPGEAFVLLAGVATPVGWCWYPEVSPETVHASFPVPHDALVVWHSDGGWNQIGEFQFVTASRSAARLTAQRLIDNDSRND